MPIIKLKGETWPIVEAVGDYIDELVDIKNNQQTRFKSIAKIARIWLDSDLNTLGKAHEKVALSLIEDLANEEPHLQTGRQGG